MNAKNPNILLRNNTGNKDKDTLVKGFAVRTKPFEIIFKELSSTVSDKPEQNYLVIGQRGTGKTTLLYRLKYAIEDDDDLNKKIIPVMFGEEQYNITELENLWENIAEYLEDQKDWIGMTKQIAEIKRNDFYEEKAADIIESWLAKKQKKIIVFVENIDVFFKKIGIPGEQRLREVLLTSHVIRIIASSTSYFDAVTDYGRPFYEFFKLIELNGLSSKECIALLLKIGEQYGEREKIESIIHRNPRRIESLRRLTGGIPRTISYLFQIFLDNEDGKALKDLYQLIDNLSFLYKAEMDSLSPQQQKVIDAIAKKWDAIAVKEIVEKTHYESKQISSILNILEKNQIIEVIPTKTKNNLYRIKERFMNIWYLMRFGKKNDLDSVVWLVRFYDVWCDRRELTQHITTHIKNLITGKYDVSAAITMGNTFLTCENVPSALKYDLYKTTKAILPRKFISDLKVSDNLLYEKINALIKDKNQKGAIEVLNEIQEKKERYFQFAAWTYYRFKMYKESEEANENLYELKPTGKTAFKIGYLNEFHLDDNKKAIAFYKLALEKKEFIAAQRLGDLYYEQGNIAEAEKMHQIGIAENISGSLMSLAKIRFEKHDLNESERLLNLAIEKKIDAAHVSLGIVYREKRLFNKAKEQFNIAINKGLYYAYICLGISYANKRKPEFDAAALAFENAIQNGIEDGFYFLGNLYLTKPDKEKEGVVYLNKSVKKGNADAAHRLGHYYQRKKDFIKSDKFFLQSAALGRTAALLCLARSLFADKRKDMKAYGVEIFEKNKEILKDYGPIVEISYGFHLLWNDQVQKSVDVITRQFPLLKEIIVGEDEGFKKDLVAELTLYFNLLIAKSQFNTAYSLFMNAEIDLKQLVKPVYYALMNYMKDEYPKEYLKAGEELKETIDEIIETIEDFKKNAI